MAEKTYEQLSSATYMPLNIAHEVTALIDAKLIGFTGTPAQYITSDTDEQATLDAFIVAHPELLADVTV